jgi:hypothetical protein
VTFHVSDAPTPATLVHCIVVCETVTAQPVAVYPLPLAPYVALTLVPVTPKFRPESVIVAPPAVTIEEPPDTPLMNGGEYDNVALDGTLVWPPTVTLNLRPAPTPGTLVHFITVFAVVTLQLAAEYSIPVGPYVANTGLPLVGPKLVPVIVTCVVPFVVIVPASPVTAGAVYVTVAVDAALI